MADENSVRRDLSRLLGSAVTADPAIMKECTQICSDYNISGEDLFFKWEAFSFNNVPAAPTAGTSRTIQSLTLDGAKALRGHIARGVARHNEKRVGATRANNARLRGSARPAHPARREGAPNPVALLPAVTSRNERIPPPVVSSVRFVGPTSDENSRRSYRYMFEKVSVRSEILDDRIEEVSDLVRSKYGIEELGDPASVTEDIVTVVGRICLDAEASSSKLSSDNIFLETSRLGGSGERVGLKFDSNFTVRETQGTRTNKSLFPGEIVAFKGKNGAGNLFVVNEILQIPPIAPAPDPSAKDTSILVASGPYSSSQALDFSSFNSIIEEAKNTRPSVLLLLGPFIDASHHVIKSGKLSSSPLSIFQQAFIHPIQSLLQKHPDMMILLVPSVRDLLNGHNVFPQGAEENDFGPLPAAIKVLPNPSLFSLNGIRFAVSTVDVLFHLKSQQHIQWSQQPLSAPANISSAQGPLDAMADLCRHLLEQRSFYPLFPVPLDFSGDINLDVSHSEHLRLSDPAPDVLVLSSTFRQFFKSVEGVSVLNPSAFGKSHIVAHLLIPASKGGDDKVCDRAQVDLKDLT